MKYYKIMPEVPAGIGENSVLERIPGQPVHVVTLHLIFEGWLGDDLMETSPVFYTTERLKIAIENSTLSGIEKYEKVKISKSENFLELYPNRNLPDFYLLRIAGKAFIDDFGIDAGILVISENAKDYLASFELNNAEIVEA